MKKLTVATIAFILALTIFSSYLLLDTFVITHEGDVILSMGDLTSAQLDNGTLNTSSDTTLAPDWSENFTDEAVWTESSYTDKDISVNITEHRISNTTVYVADVKLSSVQYLRTALANNKYGTNIKQKTSEMAAAHNAIIAINGDYYGARRQGYVIRQGNLYRNSAAADRDALAIFTDGRFSIVEENKTSAEDLLAAGAFNVLSFGPSLIVDGKVTVGVRDEVDQSMANNPRTAIACIAPLHYLLVVADGRTSKSTGLKLYQLAEFLKGLGAVTAYNLDGGGSSTMYFNGKVINNPTTNGKNISEREVSDIVYIGRE
jgi:exopolysaccharide biosynthesis protein